MNISTQICPNPIFIIGSPRSGTSVLAWALAQHSQLTTSVESDLLFDLFGQGQIQKAYATAAARPDGNDWLSQQKVSREEFLGCFGLGLNALVTSRSQGRRWIDQTPRNTLMVETIADLFPGAFFLHILRDGRKVVNSMLNFSNILCEQGSKEAFIKARRLPEWTYDFKTACQTWRSFADEAMKFCAKHPERSLTVINEHLVSDPKKVFSETFQRLGMADEPASANYFQTNRINTSFPEAAKSANATKNFPNPWSSWDTGQRDIFIAEAADAMVNYGLAAREEFAG